MPWTKEQKNLYMREWRKHHPGYNYAAVQKSKKRLRERLGEADFKALSRANYRKYRNRILKSETLRRSKIDPDVARKSRKQWWQAFRAKHGEKIKADRRDYYARTREHTLERKQNSRNANPEKTKTEWSKRASIRRARKRAATIGDLTDIAKVYDRRNWWRQWFPVEVDHVISLARGGTHEAKNLQIIYDFENRRKHARSDYKPRVVFL
jgi:hypothetical protein